MPVQDNPANEARATPSSQGIASTPPPPATGPTDTDTPPTPTLAPEPPTTSEPGPPSKKPGDTPQAVAVTPPSGPNKKFDKKRAITTIIGIILLIGGVIAGVLLVQRQQEIRERAASGSECERSPDCVLLDEPGNSGSFTVNRTITHAFITAKDFIRFNPGESDDGCYRVTIADNFIRWNRYGSGPDCKDISNVQIWLGASPTPTRTPTSTPTPTLPPEVTPTPTPRITSTPTPTLPPRVEAQCLEVKAFDSQWTQLSSSDLSNLSPGDTVRFTVSGTASSGRFDRARFTINGTLRPEVTGKRPGTDEFFDEFTIPDGVTTFTVSAQLHHTTLGWF